MCIICIDSIKIEKTGTIFENGAEFKIKHCVLCVYVQDNEKYFLHATIKCCSFPQSLSTRELKLNMIMKKVKVKGQGRFLFSFTSSPSSEQQAITCDLSAGSNLGSLLPINQSSI